MQLNLTRPLCVVDLETTGTNVVADRIVEICILKVMPDGTTDIKTRRINPGMKIPPESTAIHGITDADVADCPAFAQVAHSLNQYLENCDLAGYNSIRFDIPMLVEEFLRADIEFKVENRKLVDVQNIFHKMEQRTLSAAYRFYCAKEHTDAHSAEGDVLVTYEILKSQLIRYENVEFTDKQGVKSIPVVNDMQALHDFSCNPRNVDLVGHVVYNELKKEVFNFGKHKNRPVEEVFKMEPQYYDWMMKADFPLSTKKVITEIKLRGFNNATATVTKK
ncbi:MAG: 3'-5' exonuclease [Bacteroidota bacterium]